MIIGGSDQSLIYNDLDPSERVKVYDRGISVAKTQEERRQVLISYRSGDVWSPNIPNTEALAAMAGHFVDCIKSGRTPETDGQAGLRIVRILDAAQRSIKAQGARVTL
jgi:predicted dehydrogenase